MSKTIIIVLVVLLVIGLTIFGLNIYFASNKNKELRINYEISAGIPFKWVYEIEDTSIVEFSGTRTTRNDNKGGLVGGKIGTDYVFKGLKEGETTIIFKLISLSHENEVDQEDVYHVRVDKELKIYLIKK